MVARHLPGVTSTCLLLVALLAGCSGTNDSAPLTHEAVATPAMDPAGAVNKDAQPATTDGAPDVAANDPAGSSMQEGNSSPSQVEPEPKIEFDISHGSIIAKPLASGHLFVEDAVGLVFHGFVEAGIPVLAGFLEPDTTYSLTFHAGDIQTTRSVTTLPSPWTWAPKATIHPGMELVGPATNGCSGGFLLRDATNETLYLLSAGHCFALNDVIVDGNGARIGTVVQQFDEGSRDYLIIRIDNDARQYVSPSIPRWGAPQVPREPFEVSSQSVACHYGWGTGFRSHEETRARCGRLWGVTREVHGGVEIELFRGEFLAYQGDSGSAVIDHGTGYPIGLIHAGVGPMAGGMTFCSILEQASANGLDLALAHAPYVRREPLAVPPPIPPPIYGSAPLQAYC